MHHYYIHHSTGLHIVTVEATDDNHFMQKINSGAIPEIAPYTFMQVYCDNPESTYPPRPGKQKTDTRPTS